MQNRTPAPREERPPLPDFTPVERKYRHDGWTPERQRAFIEALADSGSVSRAAALVNMSSEGAYYLRRQKGAESFRRAWEAALDYGVARMKDIAFERAIEGYLVPCFAGGRMLGWRRKYNDRLLMFCLRHYGEDASGKRTVINYFSTKAIAAASVPPPSAGEGDSRKARAGRGGEGKAPACRAAGEDTFDVADSLRDGAASVAAAETSVTSVRTTMREGEPRDLAASTNLIDTFPGVELDEPARAAILAVLQDCAARRRAVEGTVHDPAQLFIAAEQPMEDMRVYDEGYSTPRRVRRQRPPVPPHPVPPEQMLEQSPHRLIQRDEQFRSTPEEPSWEMLDDEEGMAAIERATAEVREAMAKRSTTEAKTKGAAASLPRSGQDWRRSGIHSREV